MLYRVVHFFEKVIYVCILYMHTAQSGSYSDYLSE